MRILTIGFPVDASIFRPGEEWKRASDIYTLQGNLYGLVEQIYDFDIFIADAQGVVNSTSYSVQPEIHTQILERVVFGGILICFAAPEGMEWLHSQFKPYSTGGTVVDVIPGTPFSGVLERFRRQTAYRTLLRLAGRWKALENNNTGMPVAAWLAAGQGHMVLLPWFDQPHQVIRSLLDTVLPRLAPRLFEDEEMPEEEPPEWVSSFSIPGLQELAGEVNGLDEEMSKLQGLRDQKEEERRELERFQGLLWWTGIPLQRVAEQALRKLGIEAYPEEPKDLVIDLDSGRLFIEMEGAEGPIKVNKGRQLLDYINADPKPENVEGAILGNPFRREHPDQRPPATSQADLFTVDLRRMADRHNWRLLLTKALFDYLVRHLSGDKKAADEARKWLGII